MRAWIKRLALLAACFMVLGCGLSAQAAEGTLDVTYVPITSENFVADTLNGVDALYNRYGSTYYCNEYVIRYYEEVYGLTVRTSDSGPSVVGTEEYWFELAETPQTGDVLYASAARRGKGYSHWAIVKSYDPETGIMTLIEQNWRWNGQAGINRQLAFPSSVYYCYTLCSSSGEVATLLEQEAAESWATEAIFEAEQEGIFDLCGGYGESATCEQLSEMAVRMVQTLTGETVYVRSLPVDAAGETIDSWCAQAYAMGILDLDESGALDPDAVLTRAEAAVILSRAFALAGAQMQADGAVLSYADCAAVDEVEAQAIAALGALGAMQGDASGSFSPDGLLSLESALTVVMRGVHAIRVQASEALILPAQMTYAASAVSLSDLISAAPAVLRLV